MTDPHLVTTRNFNGKDYFIKMNVINSTLELVVTDKQTGEEWQCSYEASYIENITHKTGNFKQFDVFITMLKSGLLKTSNSVFLDLMTFEDLDSLRSHRVRGPYSHHHVAAQVNSNRRYLILTYTVEFDRIHYPLPLEYTGHPDPVILQTQIKRLEDEVQRLKNELLLRGNNKNDSKMIAALHERVEELTLENEHLHSEVKKLNSSSTGNKSKNQIQILQKAIRKLENSVLVERQSHNRLVERLKQEKEMLTQELHRIKISEKQLMMKLKKPVAEKRVSDQCAKNRRSHSPRVCHSESWESPVLRTNRTERKGVRKKSRSSSESSGRNLDFLKYTSDEQPNSVRSRRSRINEVHSRSPSLPSSRASSRSRGGTIQGNVLKLMPSKRTVPKNSSIDFENLETRITALQKVLFSERFVEK